MDSISLKVPAKINLALDIGQKREDGYHFMKMIMQAINLFDYVKIEKTDSNDIIIECNDPQIPIDENNVCFKAANTFFSKTNIINCGIKITIEKNIPVQAGLGGGSADGAGVLVGLNEMFEANLSIESLCRIGVLIGADIPFCIVGSTATAEGIGDIIQPIPNLPECYIVVCKQPLGVSTKEAFEAYDKEVYSNPFDFSKAVAAVVMGDLQLISNELYNSFEEFIDLPETKKIKTIMADYDCLNSLMSGSGSAIFGLFDNKRDAQKCMNELKESYPQTFLCHPYNKGVSIIEEIL